MSSAKLTPIAAFNDDHPYYAAPVVVIPDRKPREERKGK